MDREIGLTRLSSQTGRSAGLQERSQNRAFWRMSSFKLNGQAAASEDTSHHLSHRRTGPIDRGLRGPVSIGPELINPAATSTRIGPQNCRVQITGRGSFT